MTTLSSDDISRLAHDLVYQVAYSFYDTPYILLLKLLVNLGVANERSLAELVGLSPNDLRRYMGTLHVHRLVKRYVNKEKQLMPSWQSRPVRGEIIDQGLRVRDVHYWYMDYREFANVVKYRLAMMRKGIDERIKQEVGHRGYICPSCGRTYDSLDISHLFDPLNNIFACESCSSELVEHDPTTDPSLAGREDRMGRFNLATAPIRDALKAVEGVTLPSVNVVAWIAQNVKTLSVVDGELGREEGKRFQVVLGGEGDERERLEKERLAEAQRSQNALPVWHTHSTVTGSATALGLNGHSRKPSGDAKPRMNVDGKEGDDDLLAEHYASLRGTGMPPAVAEEMVQREPGVEEDEGEMEEMEDVRDLGVEMQPVGGGIRGKTVMVGGVAKGVEEVTEEDQEMMSATEYQAYYEAMTEA